jgi:CRISPR-associated exonuclease Cas4
LQANFIYDTIKSNKNKMRTPLPLSFIAEYAYCPRSAYWLLTEAPRSRDENEFIQDGRGKHKVVDDGYVRSKNAKRIEASVRVFSEQHGISGKLDVLEFLSAKKSGRLEIIPVEFKRGKTRENKMHMQQLNLAALCVVEMYPEAVVKTGVIYFIDDRRRVEKSITAETRASAAQLAAAVHNACRHAIDPQQFEMKKDGRCTGCCFHSLCYY